MYKEVLRSIEDIEIMPLISLMVFMLFFIGMFIWVITVDKKYVEHMKSLPLNDDEVKAKDHEEE
jgi:cytochrome c oxidase cbb3-type subunit 4